MGPIRTTHYSGTNEGIITQPCFVSTDNRYPDPKNQPKYSGNDYTWTGRNICRSVRPNTSISLREATTSFCLWPLFSRSPLWS